MNPESECPQLDRATVARLHELDPDGRHGVVRRVLTAFEASLQRMLVQLTAEQHSGRAEVVSSLAHTLKSSSASVGALALAKACAAVEQRLRHATAADLDAQVLLLIRECQFGLRAVRAMLQA